VIQDTLALLVLRRVLKMLVVRKPQQHGQPRVVPFLQQLFLQTNVVPTERRRIGLIAMDQNHWTSAELIVLMQAIRSFNVVVMVTACVVQMMLDRTRQAGICTAPKIRVLKMLIHVPPTLPPVDKTNNRTPLIVPPRT
jgi:hypothetical protein